ncbi:MAG: 5-(carboxyamino)imidazole ribonucleotide mutase [Chloroflexi bacterium]|nr:5-(carboxyamino)imidazole ribonucleotide mutase [Chloroflexota bacterium]|tara:strand:+ start:1672 stop:2178 length:507 start_codon:yes stop_codon:yes gene_type:complete
MTQFQNSADPVVSVVGGSTSDFPLLKKATDLLDNLSIGNELRVVSAHRTPDWLYEYAESAENRGIKVIIAGAGGAAHLPGMLAAKTIIPIIGVPVPLEYMKGMDSLLSIVQMPRGVPVATVAIAGAENAAILAAEIIATSDSKVKDKLRSWRQDLTDSVLKNPEAKGN